MTLESIKIKIAKLLAKAEVTNNEFEAAMFMAKVNELLERHQIEMHEIRSMGDSDPMGKEVGSTNLYASIKWARDVAGPLSRYYNCRIIYWRKGNHFKYEIVGRESARTTFELLFPFVISQVKQEARRAERAYPGTKSLSVWEREIGQALLVRIWKMVAEAEDRRAELTAKALVPVTDVDAAFETYFPTAKKGRPINASFSDAARNAAERVSIHVQTSAAKVKRIGA